MKQSETEIKGITLKVNNYSRNDILTELHYQLGSTISVDDLTTIFNNMEQIVLDHLLECDDKTVVNVKPFLGLDIQAVYDKPKTFNSNLPDEKDRTRKRKFDVDNKIRLKSKLTGYYKLKINQLASQR